MEGTLTTRVVLLQLLREGAGYGRELIRRAELMTDGRLQLSPGRVYPALKALAGERLIGGRRVSVGGARGARSRTYYDLTTRGLAVSTEQRALLLSVVYRSAPTPPDADERARMAQRLLQADQLARAGADIDRAMRGKRRG